MNKVLNKRGPSKDLFFLSKKYVSSCEDYKYCLNLLEIFSTLKVYRFVFGGNMINLRQGLGVGLGTLVLVLAFQNCSESKMTFAEIPEGELFSSSEAAEFQCLQYVEVAIADIDSQRWNIPARTADGLCYYVKIAEAMPVQPSKDSGMVRDSDVVSRDHNYSLADGLKTNNPYVMAQQKISFLLSDQRKILIAGGPSESDPILVDNFILVGVSAEGMAENITRQYLAYGTSDSSVFVDSNKVLYRNYQVGLIPFATGGTSTVSAIALENKMAIGYVFNLDIRLLDAGGSAHMSDIYLIIQ